MVKLRAISCLFYVRLLYRSTCQDVRCSSSSDLMTIVAIGSWNPFDWEAGAGSYLFGDKLEDIEHELFLMTLSK